MQVPNLRTQSHRTFFIACSISWSSAPRSCCRSRIYTLPSFTFYLKSRQFTQSLFGVFSSHLDSCMRVLFFASSSLQTSVTRVGTEQVPLFTVAYVTSLPRPCSSIKNMRVLQWVLQLVEISWIAGTWRRLSCRNSRSWPSSKVGVLPTLYSIYSAEVRLGISWAWNAEVSTLGHLSRVGVPSWAAKTIVTFLTIYCTESATIDNDRFCFEALFSSIPSTSDRNKLKS